MVIFAPQNLIMDPPFTKLDILSCRNLLIYLSPEMQKKLIPLFHYSLNPGGILFLGSAETVGTLHRPVRAAQRQIADLSADGVRHVGRSRSSFPRPLARPLPGGTEAQPGVQTAAPVFRRWRISWSCSVTPRRRCSSTTRATSSTSAAGPANTSNRPPARPTGIFSPWRAKACATSWPAPSRKRSGKKGPCGLRGLKIGTDGGQQCVDVTVQRLEEPGAAAGVGDDRFHRRGRARGHPEAPVRRRKNPAAKRRLAELEQELQQAREESQTTREEMQTSQEELRSTNEELQSTNEELQSTNEELTTSKEEMQSLNEELQTVNAELQAKVDELRGPTTT